MMTTDYPFIKVPSHCPICHHELVFEQGNNGTLNLVCPNKDCEGKLINRLDHFCSKKGLDIKGLSKSTLTKLVDWGFVNSIADIFHLSFYRDAWVSQTGFGEKSVDKILHEIERVSCGAPLDKFLCAIGIPMIGQGTMKDLLKYVDSYQDFRDKVKNGFDFSIIPNFGATMSQAVKAFDYTNADAAAMRMTILPVERKDNADTLSGFSFVITGKLKTFKNRQALVDDIEENGGKVAGSISKTTDFLIANAPEDTAKYKKAVELNIPIITENEYIERSFLYEKK